MKNSHNRKLHILPSLCAIPIIAIFLLTFSVNIYASTSDSYFPMVNNQNSLIPDDVISYVSNSVASNKNFVIKWGLQGGNGKYYYITYTNTQFVGSINNNGYQFSLSSSGNTSFTVVLKNNSGNFSTTSLSGHNFNSEFVNTNSNLYSSSVDYYTNSTISNNAGDPVLMNYIPITVPSLGHSTTYMNNIPQFGYPIGMHPTSAPTVPTYTQPTLTAPPSIDTTDIKTVAQSIFNLLAWVLQSILTYIGSIIQTLIDWFTFISNLAIWIADFIKQCFIALMDFLYNNFTTLFEPLFNFLTGIFNFLFNEDDQLSVYDLIKEFKTDVTNWINNYWSNSFLVNFWINLTNTYSYFQTLFAKVILFFDKLILLGTVNGEFSISNLVNALFVPSAPDVAAAFYNHDPFGFHSTGHAINDKANYLITTFSSLTPAKTFYIPSTTWHDVTLGGFYVDFSWYDDYKVYGDTIITIFLSISFIYWLILNFSGWLRGSSVGTDLSRLEK